MLFRSTKHDQSIENDGDNQPKWPLYVQSTVPQSIPPPMKLSPKPSRRAPNGVVSNKPIPIRLMPAERAAVERLAVLEQRSLASVCRLALLRGLADCERTQSPLTA